MKVLNQLDSLDNIKDGETRKLITKTTSSGSGNAVSAVSVSGDTITYTKGVTALTAHQNAFSNVKVGSTTVEAEQAGDTLELAAGSNVTLTPDATNDKVTIAATDTTYTFANGTNGFSVTPSGGTAQTVTVTPSITNNVTGSGTSGYLTKFNGANTITNGPQLGSSTTTYLRNNGTWEDPQNVYVGNSAPSASNYQVWVDTTGTVNNAAVIDACYPVGAIYMSTSSTNPGTALGTGTWEAYSPNPYSGIYMWKRTA